MHQVQAIEANRSAMHAPGIQEECTGMTNDSLIITDYNAPLAGTLSGVHRRGFNRRSGGHDPPNRLQNTALLCRQAPRMTFHGSERAVSFLKAESEQRGNMPLSSIGAVQPAATECARVDRPKLVFSGS